MKDKLTIIFLVLSLTTGLLTGSWYLGSQHGQKALKSAIEQAHQEALKIALQKQKDMYELELELVDKQKKIEIVYKEKIKVVTEIIESNPILKECQLTDEEFEKFNGMLREIR